MRFKAFHKKPHDSSLEWCLVTSLVHHGPFLKIKTHCLAMKEVPAEGYRMLEGRPKWHTALGIRYSGACWSPKMFDKKTSLVDKCRSRIVDPKGNNCIVSCGQAPLSNNLALKRYNRLLGCTKCLGSPWIQFLGIRDATPYKQFPWSTTFAESESGKPL